MCKATPAFSYIRILSLAAIVCVPTIMFGQTEHYYAFHGSDGHAPSGKLVADSFGNLYGVTTEGGLAGLGVVYEVSKISGHATEEVLYSFTGTNGDRKSTRLNSQSHSFI